MKIRADEAVFHKFQLDSRNKAKALIMASQVYLKEEKVLKPGQMILETQMEDLVLREESHYVSRGADKLVKAVKMWKPPIQGKICLDGGASTGGFTQVMLEEGAEKVYSVDVGYGQLHYQLRENPKVISLERENLRYLSKDKVKEPVDFFTLDLSFISIKKVLEHLQNFLSDHAKGVVLVKPQFEAKRQEVNKGVIRSKDVHLRILEEMTEFFRSNNFGIIDVTFSPITGPKGNIEFLVYLDAQTHTQHFVDLKEVVESAHRELG